VKISESENQFNIVLNAAFEKLQTHEVKFNYIFNDTKVDVDNETDFQNFLCFTKDFKLFCSSKEPKPKEKIDPKEEFIIKYYKCDDKFPPFSQNELNEKVLHKIAHTFVKMHLNLLSGEKFEEKFCNNIASSIFDVHQNSNVVLPILSFRNQNKQFYCLAIEKILDFYKVKDASIEDLGWKTKEISISNFTWLKIISMRQDLIKLLNGKTKKKKILKIVFFFINLVDFNFIAVYQKVFDVKILKDSLSQSSSSEIITENLPELIKNACPLIHKLNSEPVEVAQGLQNFCKLVPSKNLIHYYAQKENPIHFLCEEWNLKKEEHFVSFFNSIFNCKYLTYDNILILKKLGEETKLLISLLTKEFFNDIEKIQKSSLKVENRSLMEIINLFYSANKKYEKIKIIGDVGIITLNPDFNSATYNENGNPIFKGEQLSIIIVIQLLNLVAAFRIRFFVQYRKK
jgi:hypothetical protein